MCQAKEKINLVKHSDCIFHANSQEFQWENSSISKKAIHTAIKENRIRDVVKISVYFLLFTVRLYLKIFSAQLEVEYGMALKYAVHIYWLVVFDTANVICLK